MRLRNIPGAREEMAQNPYVIHEPQTHKGSWKKYLSELTGLPETAELHMEIGCGKGQFLLELAGRNPDIMYLGIEKYSSVLLRAVSKQEEAELPNLRFLRLNADYINDIFDEGEVDRLYLNFSDPWPKDRHADRRLTSSRFLTRYAGFLTKDARLEFKTDNQDLFTFSLESAQESGWQILVNTRDLHADEVLNEGNIMTEYEERFSSMGNPICKMVLAQPEEEKN